MVAFAVMSAGITSACTLTLAFGGDYLSQFVCIPSLIAVVVFMIALGLIDFYGISESVRINNGALINLILASKITYGMADQGGVVQGS
jgi:hypothetical protein